jgi:hypothetical protein
MGNVTADVTFGGKLAKLRLIASGQDGKMQLALHKMLEAYGRWTVDRFERLSGGGAGVNPSDGKKYGPWEPLSDRTLGSLVKVRRYLLILVRTGLLREMVRNGFVNVSGMTSVGAKHFVTAEFSGSQYPDSDKTTLDVLRYHQGGTDSMPQRKVMWSPDKPTRHGLAEIGKEILLGGL